MKQNGKQNNWTDFTFIRNALALGILAQVVIKWIGYNDNKAMKRYIDIADYMKENAMSKFYHL